MERHSHTAAQPKDRNAGPQDDRRPGKRQTRRVPACLGTRPSLTGGSRS